MTEVVIKTDDISEPAQETIAQTADDVERLEMAHEDEKFDRAIRDDELSTRLRALEVRLEQQQTAASAAPPEPVTVVDEETIPEEAPETIDEPIDEPEVEDEPETVEEPAEEPVVAPPGYPDGVPDDPTERPELNPTAVTEVIAEDKPKSAPKKPKEKKPAQKKGWQDFILGGSGGAKHSRRTKKVARSR